MVYETINENQKDVETKVAIIVPAFNEEELIGTTIRGIPSWVDMIIIIDDASTDNTHNIIKNEMATNPKIMVIHHAKNRGVGGAIKSGFAEFLKSDCDIMAIMAGDNQMDPNYLASLIGPIINKKADITKGNRLSKEYCSGMSTWRLFGNYILTILTKISIGYWRVSDPQNGYVAASKDAMLKINHIDLYEGYCFENDFMLKARIADLKMENVYIPARYGQEKSGIKYFEFILKTTLFLSKAYLIRLRTKL